MSLILDALNRSRQDSDPVPGLATYHPVEQVSVNQRQYLLWVALSVAVVIIAWLFMERYSAPQPAVREVDLREQAVAAPSPVVEHAPPVMPGTDSATALPAEATVVLDEPPKRAAIPQEELPGEAVQQRVSDPVAEPEAEPVAANTPPENDAVAQLYQNPPADPVIRKSQQQSAARFPQGADSAVRPQDVNKLVQMAQEEIRNAGLIDNSVPLLIDLSQQIKDGIPTIYYLRHDYSSDPSRSTVVLNSKTLSVGDSAASGMKVEEILPDSVVLNYQGTQFRLRALNSWINL
ncbi:MAG: general secretion pathway protein GspB [Halioglobus sp.]|nr:general secretion pathway protein GspB [Halioglobus sp.]